MEFLNKINWHSDDGVFFPMLDDFIRNQFYDGLIEHEVRNRHCVDVGFGTGMLSMMALKYGAKHITAYEKDSVRYQLGQHIIDELKLGDKIQLLQEEFTWQTPTDPAAVIISETVGSQIWSEQLWQSMPRQGQQTWLPGQVFLHVIAEPIPHAFATDLFRGADQFGFFSPGVDLDPKFVDLINQLAGKTTPDRSEFYTTDQHKSPVWGGWAFLRYAQVDKHPAAYYRVDIGTHTIETADSRGVTVRDIDFAQQDIQLELELPRRGDLPVLIVPRVGFEHRTANGIKRLYLDDAESWGGGCQSLIVQDTTKSVTIRHNVGSGIITYSQE